MTLEPQTAGDPGGEAALPPRPRYLPVLLTGLVALGPISTDLYLPSLPAMRADLLASEGQAQLTISAFVIGIGVAQLIHGPLSDRFGRKPVLIGGLLIYLLASVACSLASSIEMLIVCRVVQALGACVGPVVGRAIVRDAFGRDGAARVMSYIATAMALAPAVGPMIGGAVQAAFDWRANFIAMLIYGCFALVVILLGLPETNRYKDPTATQPRRFFSNYRALLATRTFLGYTAINAMAFSGLFSFISGSSFVIIEVLGVSPEFFGFSFLVFVLGFMAGAFTSGKLNRRLGGDRLILLGTSLSAASGLVGAALAFGGVLELWAILVPVFPFMLGMGLILPNAFAGAIGPFPRMAGAASALLGFIQMSTAACIGALVGQLTSGTAEPMWGAMFVTAALALAARLLLLPPGRA